jgi:hypothetical protein
MSDKATQLKAKLQKQKSKDVKKISVIHKKKEKKPAKIVEEKPKVPKFTTTLSGIEKSAKEDEKFRRDLRKIMDDNYDEQKAYQIYTETQTASSGQDIKESWDELDQESKREFALKTLIGNNDEQSWGIPGLIRKLLNLSPKLQENFITGYLENSRKYDNYYKEWSQSPDIALKIKKYTETKDQTGNTLVTINEDLRNKAIAYAHSAFPESEYGHDLDTLDFEKTKSYYDILEKIILVRDHGKIAEKLGIEDQMADVINSRNPMEEANKLPGVNDIIKSKVQKLHQKLAVDYINIAESLGAENAVNMTVGDLTTFISINRKKLLQIVPVDIAKKIDEYSSQKLIREATKIGVKNANELSKEILIIKLLQANVQKKQPISRKNLIKQAHELNIENPEDFETNALSARILTHREKKAKDSRKTKFLPSENDRMILAEKLARITGQSKEYYAEWSMEELQQRYQAIEEGEEFWEEFERETVVNALVKITGKRKEVYENRDINDLIRELETLSEKQLKYALVVAETAYSKKCVAEFRNYKWIEGKVTGVWLSVPKGKPNNVLRKYATTSYIAVVGRGKFYQANIRFFNLQCNSHAKKRIQDGNILTCFDNDNKPVQFIVGYSLQGGLKYRKKSWPILVGVDTFGNSVGKVRNNRLLIQDEELFQAEQNFSTQQNKNINDKKKQLLQKQIDEGSIGIAKNMLSRALLRVAPKVKDYEVNSPYINIAVDSVITKNQTNDDLFNIIADTIVYTQLHKAEIFQKRIKAEYYLPDILLKLSPEDKLPEVFNPHSVVSSKTSDMFVSYLRNQVRESVDAMANYLFPADPTARKPTNPIMNIEPTMDIEYDQGECVNSKDKISKDNLVYYMDPEDDKVYCLDIEILSKEFRQNNFLNPYTQKPFDKDFVRRYTVTYFDAETGKTYTFPFAKLYKRLKSGNIINPETGKVFEKSFIKAISKGSTWRESSALRNRQFKRLDRRVTTCRNAKNIINAPIESIIYYKDPDDNGVYCFTIEELTEIINQQGAVNPSTGKKFSKSFVKRFKNTFSHSLHDKGLNQPEFREIYGEEVFKDIPLPKEDEMTSKKSEEVKNDLLIPDLWELISGDFSSENSKSSFGMGHDNTTKDEDDTIAEKEDDTTEDEDDTTEDEDDTTEDEDDTTEDEDDTTEDEEKESKKGEKASKKGENESKKDEKDSKKDEKESKKGDCTGCKKSCESECHKSVMMENEIAKQCQFCSLKCMEKFRFPHFTKKKRNKK